MAIQSYFAHLLEAGASTKKGDTADPRLIRYTTSNYPSDVGVELVITDLEEFRLLAELQEPRLAVYLERLAVTLDCGLASKGSEGGKMINQLQKENTQPRANVPPPQPLDDLNYAESKQYDQNRNY